MRDLYQLFTQNKSGEYLTKFPIFGNTEVSCPRTEVGGSPRLRSGAWPLQGAPSATRKVRSPQQPQPPKDGFCFLSICSPLMVVGNCWVHCVPLVSQVYFLNQHKRKMIRASTWRCLCFQLYCLRPKTKVSADGRVQDYEADYSGDPNLSL